MNILIIVTDIQSDRAAVEFGGLLARITNADITLLHVAQSEEKKEEGEKILSQVEGILPNLSMNTTLCTGKLVTRALAESRANDYNIVVIGEGQKQVFAQQTRRSLIRTMLHRSSASVVVANRSKKEMKRILICTGGAIVAQPVIQAGAHLARAANAQATLLHVAGTIPSMYTGLNEIDESLSELLKTDTPTARHLRQSAGLLDKYGITAQLELRHGLVANEILREATKGNYDLILIGAPEPKKRLKKWLLGNVTGSVVERAPCPVLIVKGPLEKGQK